MKLRRTPTAEQPAAPVVVPKPGGKGRPTPKRTDAQKRKAIMAAPTDRKAAARKLREDAKLRRAAQDLALRTGDERNYGPLHAGKERALVRDVVDARRSFGWLGIPSVVAMLPVLLLTNRAAPPLPMLVTIAVYGLIGLIGWDYFAVRRHIKAALAERYPTGTKESTRLLVLYGVSRNNTWPTRRKPKPRSNQPKD